MILVCYDGSTDAQSAVDCAAQLMPGAETTVLCVWESYRDIIARTGAMGVGGFGMVGTVDDGEKADAACRDSAREIAREGAERATAAGLAAQPRVAGRQAGVASAILDVAADIEAGVVVLGTRGRGGVKSYLLGSVSHEVTEHADRAVLVVPSAGLAERRRGWVHHVEDAAGVS
jgi:nucleotide-binding universal stress UspA family protein